MLDECQCYAERAEWCLMYGQPEAITPMRLWCQHFGCRWCIATGHRCS